MRALAASRSLLVAILYPFVITAFAVVVVFLGHVPGAKARAIQDFVVGVWTRFSLFLFGVELKVHHLEKLPEGAYLCLFNHTSNFDILAVQSLIPRIRFGAKIELFSIPIFGAAMRAAGVLPISRSERAEVIKVYNEAQARLANGECFILSPEGTRQAEEKLGVFKSGPFLFAIAAQVPIVPVAIKGASRIQAKGHWLPNSQQWKSKIEVTFGDPISTAGMTADAKKDLQERVLESFHSLGLI